MSTSPDYLPGTQRPERKILLRLQRMEMALVRAHLAHPDALADEDYQCLRYVLNFARLDRFAPFRDGGYIDDVAVDQTIVGPFRVQVFHYLFDCLRNERDLRQRLYVAEQAVSKLAAGVTEFRKQVLSRHRNEFSAEELDRELMNKVLVLILGGGGGAGFVYTGAQERLRESNHLPGYVVGASIGALTGLFMASSPETAARTNLEFAKNLEQKDVFSRPRIMPSHTMPGLMRLHLRALHQTFVKENGEPIRFKDLAIPFDIVVGGMRRKVYERLPGDLTAPRLEASRSRRFNTRLAKAMWRMLAFLVPKAVREIVLGSHILPDFRAVDAVGISAAIPGILQYSPDTVDERTEELIRGLREQHDLAVLVDGGVANNVPARVAWRGVHEGRLGTRNAFYLAFDCFHPQWDRKHLWLWPVTRIVQLQMPANRPYLDWLIRFQPTLSPVNLLPLPAQLEQAFGWGHKQMDGDIALVDKVLAPVTWHPK